jgi:hypothetical protein
MISFVGFDKAAGRDEMLVEIALHVATGGRARGALLS